LSKENTSKKLIGKSTLSVPNATAINSVILMDWQMQTLPLKKFPT